MLFRVTAMGLKMLITGLRMPGISFILSGEVMCGAPDRRQEGQRSAARFLPEGPADSREGTV